MSHFLILVDGYDPHLSFIVASPRRVTLNEENLPSATVPPKKPMEPQVSQDFHQSSWQCRTNRRGGGMLQLISMMMTLGRIKCSTLEAKTQSWTQTAFKQSTKNRFQNKRGGTWGRSSKCKSTYYITIVQEVIHQLMGYLP